MNKPDIDTGAGAVASTGALRSALDIFAVTIFVSAILLFLVQPLFARMVLPLLGGSAAVWNTALVFYQATLLAGYAYAHAITTRLKLRHGAVLHMAVLALPLLVLPIAVPRGWVPPTSANPIPWLLAVLLLAVGPAFFAVSTTSPLLQKWFAADGRRGSADPYYLYAASNAGSMLALLSYPFFIEPRWRLLQQSRAWQWGYCLFFGLMACCAWVVWRRGGADAQEGAEAAGLASESASASSPGEQGRVAPLGAARRLRWVVLAMVPSSLMIGVTTYLSNEIASIPLLWIVPLALYLLSFICVFAARPPLPPGLVAKAFAILVLPLAVALAVRAVEPMWLLIPLHLAVLFLASVMCHGEIAADRPPPRHLTEFYLLLSCGGVLGGIFNALIAPQLFSAITEYPIMLAVACALMPASHLLNRAAVPVARQAPAAQAPAPPMRSRRVSAGRLDVLLPAAIFLVTIALVSGLQAMGRRDGPEALAMMFGPTALAAFACSRRPLRYALAIGAVLASQGWFHLENEGRVLYTARSFFGVHRVTLDLSGNYTQLVHGNTLHGAQSRQPSRRDEPLAYYYRGGPVGQLFGKLGANWRDVGVVGLGVGSLAAYARPAQHWTYFEIDPVVQQIARDGRYFTFLRDCRAPLRIVMGDARLSLGHVPDRAFDVLVLDAYSSDSIPIHLLTREAVQLYLRKIKVGGLLVFHISNRHLNLKPVLAALMRDAGLGCRVRYDTVTSQQEERGAQSSQWAVATRDLRTLGTVALDKRWQPLTALPASRVWTDDYSSILDAMTWSG